MRILLALIIPLLFTACIGEDIVDDYVAPQIRIDNPVESIEAGTSYQFRAQFINNVGQSEAVTPTWTSGDPTILAIDAGGLATGLVPGNTAVTVSYLDEFGETATTTLPVAVGESTVVVETMTRSGTVATTTFYELKGDFVLSELPNGDLKLAFGDDYVADDSLPGLYVYLTNNPNSNADALEIGRVTTFTGAHDYVFSGAGLSDYSHVLYYCKPFSVKVGDGIME